MAWICLKGSFPNYFVRTNLNKRNHELSELVNLLTFNLFINRV